MHSSMRAALVGFLTGTTLFFVLILLAALIMTITGQVPEAPGNACLRRGIRDPRAAMPAGGDSSAARCAGRI